MAPAIKTSSCDLSNEEIIAAITNMRNQLATYERILSARVAAQPVRAAPPPPTPPPPKANTPLPHSAPSSHESSADLEDETEFKVVRNKRKRLTKTAPKPQLPPVNIKAKKGKKSNSISVPAKVPEFDMLSVHPSSSGSSAEEDKSGPVRKPPPILIKNREAWGNIYKTLNANHITYRRAINTSDGIRLYLDSTPDFRLVTKSLDNHKIPFTTHQLHEDRDLVVIIRNVSEPFTEEEVLSELKAKYPAVLKVRRMRKGSKIWPLCAVHLDPRVPGARDIFNLDRIGGLEVRVENKRKDKRIPQCRRCQKFFHTANYCRASFVCSYCSKGHILEECRSKDKEGSTPTCANCKGPHKATDRRCPKAPKAKSVAMPNDLKNSGQSKSGNKSSGANSNPKTTSIPTVSTKREGFSYAQAASKGGQNSSVPPKANPQPSPFCNISNNLISQIPSDQLNSTIQLVVSQVIAALFGGNHAPPAQ